MALSNKANMDRQAEEWRFYRQQLDQMTGAANLGSSWGAGGAGDHAKSSTAGGLLRNIPDRGLTFKFNETANDKQLEQFIAQQKGTKRRGPNRGLVTDATKNPATARRKGAVRRAAGTREKKDAETAIEKFFREAEEKIEEANNANETRYNQIMGDLDARYNRVMDRIGNFGVAARADLQERAAEALGNIHANLSARGLGNSTVLAAFQQRNARDLAREQQRLSETVDTRAMNADMQMTSDKAGFMERREDVAPDWGQLQEMAMKYGVGNEGRGFNAQEDQAEQVQGPTRLLTQNDYRNQGGGQWAPPPGAVAAGRNRGPLMLGGFNPMGILNNMAGMGAYEAPWNAPRNVPDVPSESAVQADEALAAQSLKEGAGWWDDAAATAVNKPKYKILPAHRVKEPWGGSPRYGGAIDLPPPLTPIY